jgi:hypothetical protein
VDLVKWQKLKMVDRDLLQKEDEKEQKGIQALKAT